MPETQIRAPGNLNDSNHEIYQFTESELHANRVEVSSPRKTGEKHSLGETISYTEEGNDPKAMEINRMQLAQNRAEKLSPKVYKNSPRNLKQMTIIQSCGKINTKPISNEIQTKNIEHFSMENYNINHASMESYDLDSPNQKINEFEEKDTSNPIINLKKVSDFSQKKRRFSSMESELLMELTPKMLNNNDDETEMDLDNMKTSNNFEEKNKGKLTKIENTTSKMIEDQAPKFRSIYFKQISTAYQSINNSNLKLQNPLNDLITKNALENKTIKNLERIYKDYNTSVSTFNKVEGLVEELSNN